MSGQKLADNIDSKSNSQSKLSINSDDEKLSDESSITEKAISNKKNKKRKNRAKKVCKD